MAISIPIDIEKTIVTLLHSDASDIIYSESTLVIKTKASRRLEILKLLVRGGNLISQLVKVQWTDGTSYGTVNKIWSYSDRKICYRDSNF